MPKPSLRTVRRNCSWMASSARRSFVSLSASPSRAASEIGVPLGRVEIDVCEYAHGDHPVALGEVHAAHAGRAAPPEQANVGGSEAGALAAAGGEEHIIAVGAGLHADDAIVVAELHGDLAGGRHIHEVARAVAPDGGCGGRKHELEARPLVFVFRHRQDGRDGLAFRPAAAVDQRFAARLRRGLGQTIDLELVGPCRRWRRTAPASCVLTTKTCETKSSSRVLMPARPLPPRRWAR